MIAALETRDLLCRFGGVIATDRVALKIEAGARHALIGPNGAGKTTLLNLLSGWLRADAGRILLHGEDITRLAAHRRVRRGLVRTFQISQLFGALTPLESITLAIAEREGLGSQLWRPIGAETRLVDEAVGLIDQFGLSDVMASPARILPYGRQRLLEIALALACRPRVLLLDEPAAGVPAQERPMIMRRLAALPETVTIVLIEHDMDLVFRFASRVSVLVNGALMAEGSAGEIAANAEVRAVYLGGPADG
jgi:ABC-type branched-subunit amino acid transport system ATPase component